MTIASNLSFLQNSAGAITTGTVNAIGSPITFSVNNTEYNRIDTNGYSLMGYTTSQGAYKLQVNGTIYASGSIIGNITGNVTGTVTTSSNVAGGTAGQLVYQSAPGITGFAGPGTSGQLLVSAGTGAPTYTNTASISVGYAANVLSGATGSIHYQTAANATGMLAIGTAGQFLSVNAGATAPQWTTTSTAQIGYAANILAGTTGQLVYQSAANTTGFVGPGTANQILVSAGASAPVYTNTGSIQVGYSANILAGTTGQLHYQSAANTTGFVGPGTAGQFLQSAGAGAPTYVSTSTMYVQRAVQADSAVGGAGSVANALTISTGLSGSPSTSYNGSAAITLTLNTATLMANSVSASTATNAGIAYATIAAHTAGTGLSGSTFNGSTAQTWTLNTATLMASSVAIAGGTTGQLHYQSAANTTGFVGPGTAGQFLQSAGAGAPTYVNTGTMYVQRAVQADSASGTAGSASQVNTQAQLTSANYYPTFVSANNASATAMSVYTTSNFYINPFNGAIQLNGTGGFNLGQPTPITFANGQQIKDNGGGGLTVVSNNAINLNAVIGLGGITMSPTTSAYAQQSGALLSVNGGAYLNGITTVTNSVYVTSGIVAIGGTTTYSNAKIQLVNGDVASGGSNLSQIAFQYGSGGYTHYVQSRHDSLGTTDGNALVFNLNTGTTVGASSAFGTGNALSYYMGYLTHRWNTSATERLRLTANGGVSFGASGTAYGSSGQVLQSNGDAPPSWVAPSSLAAASATQVTTQAQTANANYYPVFVSANNASATAMSAYTTSSFYINASSGNTVHGGTVLATAGLFTNALSGATRAVLSSNGDLTSFYAAESTARIQLGRDVGISGGAGLALGGSSYALVSTGDTTGATLYFKLSASAGTASTSPNMTLNSTGLGIGTTSINTPLAFADSVATKIQFNGNNANGYTVGLASAVNSGDAMMKFVAGATGAGEFGFYNTTNLRLFINNSGNVGIGGVSAPSTRLHIKEAGATITSGNAVNGTSMKGLTIDNSNNDDTSVGVWFSTGPGSHWCGISGQRTASASTWGTHLSFYTHDDTTTNLTYAYERMRISSAGYVGIANTAPAQALHVTGQIIATNEITAYYSDRRLKENVNHINNAVEKVSRLNGITYTPNDLAESFGFEKNVDVVGLFADEVEAVLPQAVKLAPFDQTAEGVSKSGENYKTVQYEKLVPLLVEAIKEQQQTINDQNSRIEKLEELVKNLAGKYSE